MKLILATFLSLCLPLNARAETPKAVNFDLSTSVIKWTGKKVTGSHVGTVNLKSAEGKLNSDKTVSGTFKIDMSSIKNVDLEDAKYNKKLINHLNSEDFFNVEHYPEVVFNITGSSPIANAKAGEPNVSINGNLSIKGITQAITFPAFVKEESGVVSAKASVPVDRTKFNIRYGSGKFFQGLGDKLIYDDFVVDIELNGKVI